MGGMSKPKDAKLKGEQRKHNQKTRWLNSRCKPIYWDTYTYKFKNKQGEVEEFEKVINIPRDLMFDMFDETINNPDKANPPFDALHLDWCEELLHMAADYNAKIGKINLGNGLFLYRVYVGGNVYKPKALLLEVESSRTLTLKAKPTKRKKEYNGHSNRTSELSSPNSSGDSSNSTSSGSQEASKENGAGVVSST